MSKAKKKLNKKQVKELIKAASEKKQIAAKKEEIPKKETAPVPEVNETDSAVEFISIESPKAPSVLEDLVASNKSSQLESIGEKEPKKEENKQMPYAVKYSSNDYNQKKNYENVEGSKESELFDEKSFLERQKSNFDSSYRNATMQSNESSGVEDLRAAEQGYKNLNRKNQMH